MESLSKLEKICDEVENFVPGSGSEEVAYTSQIPFLNTNTYFGLPDSFAESIKIMDTIKSLIQDGDKFVSFLYSYRSYTKAIPSLSQSFSDEEKADLNFKTFNLMNKTFEKVRELAIYKDLVIEQLTVLFSMLPKKNEKDMNAFFVDEAISFAVLLDTICKIDSLLELRASLKNDFAFYKRCTSLVQDRIENIGEVQKEIVQIGMFINDPLYMRRAIIKQIRVALQKKEDFIERLEILVTFLNKIHSLSEEMEKKHKPILSLSTKFAIKRTFMLLVFIGEHSPSATSTEKNFSIIKNKGFTIKETLKKVIKQNSILPMLGEMTIDFHQILTLCESYDKNVAAEWRFSNYKIPHETNVNDLATEIYLEYVKISKRIGIAIMYSKLSEEGEVPNISNPTSKKQSFYPQVETLYSALSLLNKWMGHFKVFIARKYNKPLSEEEFQVLLKQKAVSESLAQFATYMKALSLHFNDEERLALTKIIFCIKKTERLIKLFYSKVEKRVRNYFGFRIEFFVERFLVKAAKKARKGRLLEMGKNLEELLERFLELTNYNNDDDYSNYSVSENVEVGSQNSSLINLEKGGEIGKLNRVLDSRKSNKRFSNINIGTVSIMGSSNAKSNRSSKSDKTLNSDSKNMSSFEEDFTNKFEMFPKDLLPIRYWIETIISLNPSTGGLFSSKVFSPEAIEVMDCVWGDTFMVEVFQQFDKNLAEATNMSFLWLREYYLDVTNCLEFPIETSLPWLLLENALKSQQPGEVGLAPIEIYNDVAEKALAFFNKRFLYDEVKAEAGLALERIFFEYSNSIYRYYKETALELLLYKYTPVAKTAEAEESFTVVDGWPLRTRDNFNLDQILLNQSLHVLGKKVSLKECVQQHLNKHFRMNLMLMLNSFETKCSKQALLEAYFNFCSMKHAHRELSKKFVLDDFEEIFTEVDGRVGVNQRGKFLTAITEGFLENVIMNFAFNSSTQRFVVSVGERRRVEFGGKEIKSSSGSADGGVSGNGAKKGERGKRTRRGITAGNRSVYQFGRYAQIYSLIVKELCGFVGSETFELIFEIISFAEKSIFVEIMTDKLIEKVRGMNLFVQQILKGSPSIKLPQLNYSPSTIYGYFELALKFLKEHDELCTEIFQRVRELGNTYCLIKLCSKYIDVQKIFQENTYNVFKEEEKGESLFTAGISNLLNVTDQTSKESQMLERELAEIAENCEEETNKAFAEKCSCLNVVIKKVHKVLSDENILSLWQGLGEQGNTSCNVSNGNVKNEDVVNPNTSASNSTFSSLVTDNINSSSQHAGKGKEGRGDKFFKNFEKIRNICRFWSIISFIFCTPNKRGVGARVVTYGDGFFVSGAFMLFVSKMTKQFRFNDFSHYVISLVPSSRIDDAINKTNIGVINLEQKEEIMKLHRKFKISKETNFLFGEKRIASRMEVDMQKDLDMFVINALHGINVFDEEIENISGEFL